MEIILSNSERLKLPLYPTVEERIIFTLKNLLNTKAYEKDYIFNLIASYIVFCEEYSIKPVIKKYSEKAKEKTSEVENKVIYSKSHTVRSKQKSFMFIINDKEEEHLKKNVQAFYKIKDKGYSENFIYKDSMNRLEICDKAKGKCCLYKIEIEKNKNKVEELKDEIKLCYKKLKQGNNQNTDNKIKNKILKLCSDIRWLENEIRYLEEAIRLEYQDYYNATEFSLNSSLKFNLIK